MDLIYIGVTTDRSGHRIGLVLVLNREIGDRLRRKLAGFSLHPSKG